MTDQLAETGSSTLWGRCDNCDRPRGVRSLIAVCVQPTQSSKPRWLLLCGSCYVDGECLP